MVTSVKFQCLRSGNFVSFIDEGDIAGMRTHEGYKEVKDETANESTDETPDAKEEATVETRVLKKRGRPFSNK